MNNHLTGTVAQEHFRINYTALTDPGCRRFHNEDAFLVDEAEFLFGVADGVGSLGNGEIASRMTVDSVIGHLQRERATFSGHISLLLDQAVAAANRAVYDYGAVQGRRIASTLCCIALAKDEVFVVNIGDSRAYRWRHHQLSQLTTDHTLKQEMLDNGIVADVKKKPFH
ncbi:MAG: hypothetical protein CSA21_00420 [Deltaproteobacteria bacterium]|nr:MAG: hypothetical protein CSA21_00420 [Deltaproteobacteria bacterium]